MQVTGNNISSTNIQLQLIDFITPTFSPDCSLRYNISIREFPNGYYLYVWDTSCGKCVAIQTVHELSPLSDILQLKYNKIYYTKHTVYATVPNVLIDDTKDCNIFLPLDKNKRKRTTAAINNLNDDISLIFDAKNYHKLPLNVEMLHPMSCLITRASHHTNNNICIAEHDGHYLNIVVKLNNKLQLANSFEYLTWEDAVYFILATYQQLSLDVNTHPLLLCGKPDDINKTNTFICDYINIINIAKPSNLWDNTLPSDIYSVFYAQESITLI